MHGGSRTRMPAVPELVTEGHVPDMSIKKPPVESKKGNLQTKQKKQNQKDAKSTPGIVSHKRAATTLCQMEKENSVSKF